MQSRCTNGFGFQEVSTNNCLVSSAQSRLSDQRWTTPRCVQMVKFSINLSVNSIFEMNLFTKVGLFIWNHLSSYKRG